MSCQKPVTLISAHHGVDKSTQVYPGSTLKCLIKMFPQLLCLYLSLMIVSRHSDRSRSSALELSDQEISDAELSCFQQSDDASMAESLDLTLCHLSPELTIEESKLSPTLVSRPVFYYEENDVPGVCIDRGDNCFSWS